MSHLSDRSSQAWLSDLGAATFSDPRERAMAHLIARGVLIVDDNPSQLRALHDVCVDFLEIPEHNIHIIRVEKTLPMNDIATTLERALRDQLRTSGRPFASVITDYNFSSVINSIDVWAKVEARLTDESARASWIGTGRVLVTGHERDDHIISAERIGLIDAYLHKPLKLDALTTALCEAVLKRLS